MRSFLITALCFSLFYTSYARVAHSFHDLIDEDFEKDEIEAEPKPHKLAAVKKWMGHIFRRQANATTCYEDEYYTFVEDDLGAQWCQMFMHYPNVTSTVEYTPTTTIIVTVAPHVNTEMSLDRVTPTNTNTVTITAAPTSSVDGQQKRAVQPLAPQEKIDEAFRRFRRQNANAAGGSDANFTVSFSSACSCQDYTGPTVIVSYTNQPALATLTAFVNEFTTLYTTVTANPVYVTQTVTAGVSPTSAASSVSVGASQASGSVVALTVSGTEVLTLSATTTETTSSNTALPTSPAFTCPDDNSTTISQMIGNERFDYLVLCNFILGDEDLYTVNYSNLGQCAAACSLANLEFNSPVCQGVSFYTAALSENCHLKRSANDTYASDGVDTAILQRIAIAYPVDNNSTSNITTESAPFGGQTPTQDPNALSSSMSSILANSSTEISTITPGPPVPSGGFLANSGPFTAYSTFVSDGSTFSTGSLYSFSTHYANGSWWWTIVTSWSVAWTASTEIIGISSGGTAVQNETSTSSQQQTDTGTGYTTTTTITNTTSFNSTGYNVTEVIQNVTVAQNGSQIASTATTYLWQYVTATGAQGTGGAGGPATASAGAVTSVYSTELVTSYVLSGGTGMGGSGAAASTQNQVTVTYPGSTFSTMIVESSGIAGSGNAGGSGGGMGGANGTGGSGGPTSGVPSTVSVIMTSGGTQGSAGTGGSGYAPSSSSTPAQGTFSNQYNGRTGGLFPSSSSWPGSYSAPYGMRTGGLFPSSSSSWPGSYSAPYGLRTGGLLPSSSSPTGTGSTLASAVNTSLPTGTVSPTGSTPLVSGPTTGVPSRSPTGSYSAPGELRSGPYGSSSTAPASISPVTASSNSTNSTTTTPCTTSTSSSMPSPLSTSSCPSAITMTVTVNQTFTQWSCASTCGPQWYGGPASTLASPMFSTGSMSTVSATMQRRRRW